MLTKIIIFAVISVAIYFAIALGLIASQQPSGTSGEDTLAFDAIERDETPEIPLQTYQAADGTELGYRYLPAKAANAPLFVFIHGSGWHGGGYQALAHAVHGDGDIAVVLPDLRGHGPNPKRRGDVEYIGQFEDDIAALVKELRQPGQRFILGGHSSGGGLVVRYAGGAFGDTLDGAILMAPYLKYNAPTMRPDSGGWANVLLRRIIGLSMLNNAGVTALNGLKVVEFNFPQSVLLSPLGKTATTQYSHRLNQSYAPRMDYLGDIAKLPPFLLIAGREDEAFLADQYEPTLKQATSRGRYVLLDGVGHLDVYGKAETANMIRDFILQAD